MTDTRTIDNLANRAEERASWPEGLVYAVLAIAAALVYFANIYKEKNNNGPIA